MVFIYLIRAHIDALIFGVGAFQIYALHDVVSRKWTVTLHLCLFDNQPSIISEVKIQLASIASLYYVCVYMSVILGL